MKSIMVNKKTRLKAKILQACISIQNQTIDHLKSVVEENQKSANEYGAPKDRYDSFRTQLLAKRDMFALQLTKANEQFEILNRIPVEKHYEKVEFGAIVITEKQTMFISAGIGKVTVDDEIYYAISPAVPVYKAMEGKKAGEEFQFNGSNMKILDIF